MILSDGFFPISFTEYAKVVLVAHAQLNSLGISPSRPCSGWCLLALRLSTLCTHSNSLLLLLLWLVMLLLLLWRGMLWLVMQLLLLLLHRQCTRSSLGQESPDLVVQQLGGLNLVTQVHQPSGNVDVYAVGGVDQVGHLGNGLIHRVHVIWKKKEEERGKKKKEGAR